MTGRDEQAAGPPAGDVPHGDAGDPDADADRPSPSDPRRIDLVAVTESDVVDALEAAARSDRDIVLRVTPPFSGRMRARLHDAGSVGADTLPGASDSEPPDTRGDDSAGAPSIHIPPERFVDDPPAYPTVDDTEDELRASAEPYTKERHRERHQAAVGAWRAAVRERLTESVSIRTPDGDVAASVAYLG